MTRLGTLLVVAALVTAATAVPFAAAAQPDGSPAADLSPFAFAENNTTEQADGDSLPPGAQFAGAIGVQRASIEGDLEERTFGVRVARANSSNGTARIVTQTVAQLQERLQEIEAQRTQLREMRANGSISQAEYQARLAALATRTQQLERLANRSHETARGLPAAVRERNQVDLNAIDQVRTSARNMSAGEMSTAARSIAGNGNGPTMSRPGTGDPGQGAGTNQTVTTHSRAEARIQTAERVLDQARNQVQRAEDAGVNPAQARETLNRAEAALEDAEAALESGDGDAAADNADEAIRLARQAGAEARNALATGSPDLTTGSSDSQTSSTGPPNGTNVTTGPQVTTGNN